MYDRYSALLLSSEIRFLRFGARDWQHERAQRCQRWFNEHKHYDEAFRAKYLELEIKSFLKGWNNVAYDRESLIEVAKLCNGDGAMAHAYYFKMNNRDYTRPWEEDVHILDSARMFAQRSKDTILLSKIRIMSVLPENGSEASFDSTFTSLKEANDWKLPELKCMSFVSLGTEFAPNKKNTDSALLYLKKG